MVSLYNMISHASSWGHITSSIPAVDKCLFTDLTRGIFDLQTVPHCQAMNKVIASVMISHLMKSKSHKVIIVNTFNEFPIELVTGHKSSDKWSNNQITIYDIDTVAKLLIFLKRQNRQVSGNTILVINNFHDLLSHYKLELSATYQDILLKLHAQNNLTTIRHQERTETEGVHPQLVEVPKSSGLLKDSPSAKFTGHVNYISNMISQLSYNSNMLVFLTGALDIKFKSVQETHPNSSQMFSDTQTQTQAQTQKSSQSFRSGSFNSGRLALTYSNKTDTKSILDSIITKRLMFYKDWYHKSPKFKRQKSLSSQRLRQIYCVDFDDHTVYFDYKELGVPRDTRDTKETPFEVVDLSAEMELQDNTPNPSNTPKIPSSPNMSLDSSPTRGRETGLLTTQTSFPTGLPKGLSTGLPTDVPTQLPQLPSQFKPLAASTSQMQPPEEEPMPPPTTTSTTPTPPIAASTLAPTVSTATIIDQDLNDSIIEDSQDMGIPLDKLRPEFF